MSCLLDIEGGLAAVMVFCVLLLNGCSEEKSSRAEGKLPDQVISSFRLLETNGGELVFEMWAVQARVYEEAARVEVVGPRVTFFDENQMPYSTLVADSGTVFQRTEDLIARGHVCVETVEGTRLVTDSLVWDNRSRRVNTDAPVVFETPQGRIEGEGLISDAALERIEVKSEVRGSSEADLGL